MDVLAPVRAFDRLQRRHRALALPVAVLKKFSDDQAGNLAAVMAYYAFFSLFPLLLVFTTVLGFVLADNPQAQKDILDSTLEQIPLAGEELKAGTLKGSGVALAVGLVVTLLSGLGVTLASQTAFNRIYGVPMRERPNPVRSRLRGLGLLVVLGTLQIVSTVASGLVSAGFGGALLTVAGVLLALALNLLLFGAAFRLLTDRSVPTPTLGPGIVAAAVLWTAVQGVGGAYLGYVVRHAGPTYGAFATVIGLLTWLFLGARIVVYSAELNTVVARRLWPRGIVDPPTPADREVLRELAQIELRRDDQRVDVGFEPRRRRARRSA